MKHLPTITRLAIPAAMVSFLTIEITKSQQVSGWLAYLVMAAAFFTSLGIELWGIIAGDNLDKSWKLNHGRAWAVIQMIVYVIVGGWLLRHNLTIIMLPLVAALAYVASGFADSLKTAVNRQQVETAESVTFDREQLALDRELERKMKAAEMKLKHEERLARIEAKAKQPAARSQPVRSQSPAEPAKHYECVCGRVFEGSRSYNAHRRHCEMPANEPAKIYENGAAK